jgi:hypothetical protein
MRRSSSGPGDDAGTKADVEESAGASDAIDGFAEDHASMRRASKRILIVVADFD